MTRFDYLEARLESIADPYSVVVKDKEKKILQYLEHQRPQEYIELAYPMILNNINSFDDYFTKNRCIQMLKDKP